MRVHLGACVLVVLLAAWLGVGREEWACLLLAMGMVTAAEAVNTAIEGLCDFIEEGLCCWRRFSRRQWAQWFSCRGFWAALRCCSGIYNV